MRSVLRIEHDGGGIYRPGSRGRGVWTRVIGEHVDREAHPLPFEDSGLGTAALNWLDSWPEHARFGFTCVAQLRRWVYFDEWIVALSEAGAELVVYEVPDECFCGYTQVIFNMTTAIELDRQPLAVLLTGDINHD